MGITEYAAHEIGDVTWVELPEPDAQFAAEDVLCAIESVKAANDIYAPMGGTVVASNPEVEGSPTLVNKDPEGQGWIARLSVEDASEWDKLMSKDEYTTLVKELKADKD